jgi:F-type H+-transporting ATPase subunit gamma
MREKRAAGAEVTVVTVGARRHASGCCATTGDRAEFTAMPDSPTTYDIGPIVRDFDR